MSGRIFFRNASLTPDTIAAGDSDEFAIALTLGDGYTAGPSRLIFDFSAPLGTSCPTRSINEASGYVEAYVDNPDVAFTVRIWDMSRQAFVAGDQPATREGGRLVVLDLSAGLRPGDAVALHWGETTRGFGPGAKATTVVPRPTHRVSIRVRYFDGPDRGLPDRGESFPGHDRPVPDAEIELAYTVRPRALRRLRLVRQWDKARLVPHDVFWNVAEVPRLEAVAEADAPARRNDMGVFEFDTPRVRVAAREVPLIEGPAMDHAWAGMHLFWGDLHTHSCHSCDAARTVRMEQTPADLMRFARDAAGLDFFAVTDHHVPLGGGAGLLLRDRWERLLEAVRAHHRPGAFAVFPGFETSCPRGDTVVVFNGEPGYARIDKTGAEWGDIRDVWRSLADLEYLSIPHFHTAGGRLVEGLWWAHPDPAREPVLEILSDHGSYEREHVQESGRAECKRFRFDRCGVYFLQQGYRYGFVGHSDDHKGHAGVNALTAVFAPTLDRDAIFEAYRQRRVYATSNARIRLVFTANGALMGAVLPLAGRQVLGIDVVGEGALKKVELFRNGVLYRRFAPDGIAFQAEVAAGEQGPVNWYVRVTQRDNQVAISSPIWFA